jgi:hypothetical protein
MNVIPLELLSTVLPVSINDVVLDVVVLDKALDFVEPVIEPEFRRPFPKNGIVGRQYYIPIVLMELSGEFEIRQVEFFAVIIGLGEGFGGGFQFMAQTVEVGDVIIEISRIEKQSIIDRSKRRRNFHVDAQNPIVPNRRKRMRARVMNIKTELQQSIIALVNPERTVKKVAPFPFGMKVNYVNL